MNANTIDKFIIEEMIDKTYKSRVASCLIVKVKVPKRKFARDKKVIITDLDVRSYVSNKYDIVEVLQSNEISNNIRDNRFKKDYTAEWRFIIKKEVKPRRPSKPKQELYCNKNSFRGRISNIAKQAQTNKES